MNIKGPKGRGAYSAIVYEDGDLYVAEDDVGTVILEGTNAAAAIQAAEDSLGEGDLLMIRPGTYPLTSQVVFNTVHETISAYGALLTPDGNAHNIYIGAADNPYSFHNILGLYVDATNLTSGGFGVEIKETYNNFTDWFIKEIPLNAMGITENGIDTKTISSNRYHNLYMEAKAGSQGSGILFGTYSNDAMVTNFEFNGHDGTANTAITIATLGGAHLFQNMHIYNMQHGIKITNGSYNRFLNIKITTFSGNGIYIIPESNTSILNNFQNINIVDPNTNAICVNCDGTTQQVWETYLYDFNLVNSNQGNKVIYQTGTTTNTYLDRFNIATPANLHATPFTLTYNYEISGGSLNYKTEKYGTSTGTGAQQTIAHGVYGIPDIVMIGNIEDGANPYQSAAADATNIYITGVNGKDWWWSAIYKP
jgi:hypothetical protein